MLVTEDKMVEGDGLLISHPGRGVGYQLAGAFKRLGRRTIALLADPSEAEDLKRLPVKSLNYHWKSNEPPAGASRTEDDARSDFPSQTGEFSAFFVTPHPQLGLNQALTENEAQSLTRLVRAALKTNPDLHLIFTLPDSTPSDQIKTFSQLTPRFTVFLVAAVFGFRDGGLMDSALRNLGENPARLLKPLGEFAFKERPIVYAGDVAAFLISAPGQARFFGKVLQIPPTTTSLEEWRKAFVAHFAPKPSIRQKISARFSDQKLFADLFHGDARATVTAENATDYFPTSMTPLDRALKNSADYHRRDPELGLVFPPGRAL